LVERLATAGPVSGGLMAFGARVQRAVSALYGIFDR